MKLKKSISIILSASIITNFACSYMASAADKTTAEGVCHECTTEYSADLEAKNQLAQNEILSVQPQVSYAVPAQPVNYQPQMQYAMPPQPVNYQPQVTYVVSNQSSNHQKLVDDFLMKNAKYLPASNMGYLTTKLQKLSDDDIYRLNSVSFHNPDNITLLSVFFGNMGIDRMLIGKIGTGILKMLTGGGFGIWWLVDIFQIKELTKEQNWKKLQEAMQYI